MGELNGRRERTTAYGYGTGHGCNDESGSHRNVGPTCHWNAFKVWREVSVRVECSRPWVGGGEDANVINAGGVAEAWVGRWGMGLGGRSSSEQSDGASPVGSGGEARVSV